MEEELTKEDILLRDIEFTTNEAMGNAANSSSMEAKARFLQVAQMGNLAKALLISAETVRNGLIWVSDSIDKTVGAPQEEAQDDSEDGAEEDEDPDPAGPVRLVPITPHIRKRYIRTVDGLQLEKAE